VDDWKSAHADIGPDYDADLDDSDDVYDEKVSRLDAA
jgi:hypothetical protein